jgi:MFS family permease
LLGKRIFHGWFVVAACFLCMLVAAGIGWFTFPVFIKPFENEFGWSRTQINGAVGLWAVVAGICSPILGHWIDRLGARRIILAGVVTGGLCCMALAEMHSLGHLYAVLFVVAIGSTASTYVPVASVIARWFVARRGLAMSLAMVGMGMGGFIMPNVANFLIETMGWRWAYRILGVTIWAVLLPAVALWVHNPERLGLRAHGDDAASQDAPGEGNSGGVSARQALAMPRFWGIGIADLLVAVAFIGVTINMVVFAIDAGIESKVAAFAYSSIHGATVLGVIAVGAAADRFNKGMMISVSYALPAVGVLFLFGLKAAGPLFWCAVILGLCGAGHVVLWPLVVSDCFGPRAYATIMGFLSIFYTMGAAIGPPVAGYIYDALGSYHWLFVLSVGVFIASGISMALAAVSRPEINWMNTIGPN